MTRKEIIDEFTKNIVDFKELARNISNEQDADDLFQTCSLMLLEFSEDRLIEAYNPTQGLKPYFIRMLVLQYRSKTSRFHKHYRKQEIDLQNKYEDIILNLPVSVDEYTPAMFTKINEVCDGIYEGACNVVVADLEKTVWELYVETGSLRKTLAELPDGYADIMDLKSVHTIVKKFQRTIKMRLAASD